MNLTTALATFNLKCPLKLATTFTLTADRTRYQPGLSYGKRPNHNCCISHVVIEHFKFSYITALYKLICRLRLTTMVDRTKKNI